MRLSITTSRLAAFRLFAILLRTLERVAGEEGRHRADDNWTPMSAVCPIKLGSITRG